MNFLYPFWLWIGIALSGMLMIGFLYGEKKRQIRRRKLVSDKAWEILVVNHSSGRQNIKYLLCLLGTMSLAIALARPRWGYTWKEYHTQGVDVLFAVDVSRSMLAEDLKPNRLERTKIAIQDFVQQFHGHRIGLIAFAYDSFIQCPMTLDYRAFLQSLEALDIYTIPQQGTAIASAIQAAEKALEKTRNERIVLLFSDGEELKKDAMDAAEAAAKNGIHIFTIGVGSLEGAMIPIQDKDRTIQYMQDAEGKNVITKLDESTLQKISEITQGRYIHLSIQELQQLLKEIQERFPIQEQEIYREKVFTERFSYFLLLAIGLWFIEALLSTYRRPRRRYLSCLIYGLMAFEFHGGISEPLAVPSKGEQFFAEQQYDKAEDYYQKMISKDPENSKILYNLATTQSAQGNLSSAIENFEKALKTSEKELQSKTFFNLGNAYFEQGKRTEETEMETIQKLWEKSVLQYDNALELSKDYKEAENNRRYVQQHLDELLRKREQQQQQQNQEQSSNPSQDTQKSPSEDQQSESNPNNKSSGNAPSSEKNKKQEEQPQQQDSQEPSPQQPSDSKNSPSDQSQSSSPEDKENASPKSSEEDKKQEEQPQQQNSQESSPQQPSDSKNSPSDQSQGSSPEDKENASSKPSEESPKKSPQDSQQKPAPSDSHESDPSESPPDSASSSQDKESEQDQDSSQQKDQPDKRSSEKENQQWDHPQNTKEEEENSSANAEEQPSELDPKTDEGSSTSNKEEGKEEDHPSQTDEKQEPFAPSPTSADDHPEIEQNPDGKMTLADAKALLDSEAGHEKKLPLIHVPSSPKDALQQW